MVWYIIGVNIINRTLYGRAEIQNFSSRVQKIFHSFAALTREIFFNTRREISYLRAAMEYPLSEAYNPEASNFPLWVKNPSSETQGQIVGARESLNGRKNMARRKVTHIFPPG